jgi:hypothetical protein
MSAPSARLVDVGELYVRAMRDVGVYGLKALVIRSVVKAPFGGVRDLTHQVIVNVKSVVDAVNRDAFVVSGIGGAE